jgi:hypothetical protein
MTTTTTDDAGLYEAVMVNLRHLVETQQQTLITVIVSELAERAPTLVDEVIADVEARSRLIEAARERRVADSGA